MVKNLIGSQFDVRVGVGQDLMQIRYRKKIFVKK